MYVRRISQRGCACLLAGGEFAVGQQDILTIDINRAYTDTLDIHQFINVFELTMFSPVADNGLSFAQANAFERLGDLLGAGGITLTG